MENIEQIDRDKISRRGKVALVVGLTAALIGSGAGLYSNMAKTDSENPQGRETCYLSEADAGLPVTRADVDCDAVVIGTGSPPELIFPQKIVALQDYCLRYMQRGKDGTCEYFPPEYFEDIESEKQSGISI